jgi:hypothetical protein
MTNFNTIDTEDRVRNIYDERFDPDYVDVNEIQTEANKYKKHLVKNYIIHKNNSTNFAMQRIDNNTYIKNYHSYYKNLKALNNEIYHYFISARMYKTLKDLWNINSPIENEKYKVIYKVNLINNSLGYVDQIFYEEVFSLLIILAKRGVLYFIENNLTTKNTFDYIYVGPNNIYETILENPKFKYGLIGKEKIEYVSNLELAKEKLFNLKHNLDRLLCHIPFALKNNDFMSPQKENGKPILYIDLILNWEGFDNIVSGCLNDAVHFSKTRGVFTQTDLQSRYALPPPLVPPNETVPSAFYELIGFYYYDYLKNKSNIISEYLPYNIKRPFLKKEEISTTLDLDDINIYEVSNSAYFVPLHVNQLVAQNDIATLYFKEREREFDVNQNIFKNFMMFINKFTFNSQMGPLIAKVGDIYHCMKLTSLISVKQNKKTQSSLRDINNFFKI